MSDRHHDEEHPVHPAKEPLDAGGHPMRDTAAVPEGPGAITHVDGEIGDRPSRTLWGDAWYRLRRNKLATIALVWIVFVILVALTADLWVPQTFGDPEELNTADAAENKLMSPSLEHPFGTDKLGRDVLSRVIYGTRISLSVGIVAVAISIILGLIAGALAGFYGGFADTFIMRLADIFFAFPYILFAIAMIAVLGPGYINVFIAIGVLGWPSIARVFRSSILSVKENEYVDAARALGASDVRILFRHILPNSIAPIIVYGTMMVGGAILSEAALSFLGMGVQPPTPSWGLMLADARAFMQSAPWMMIWPGLAIVTTVLSFVLMGDGLRDALDVKMSD